jgi:hypothetical protein
MSGVAVGEEKKADTLTEEQKIEKLMSYVENLQGATFIRNGEEHTPKEAAQHMRDKRKSAGDKVKTAKDFIELCASKSKVSGQEYKVRLADKTEVTSNALLTAELARIESGATDDKKDADKK